jgi:hypothetical protein
MRNDIENNLILFLDESGDHNLTKIDPQYPIFVLAGCVFKPGYYNETAVSRIESLKEELFETKEIILHTEDITHNRNGFERIVDEDFRNNFYKRINCTLDELDFQIIACAIKKDKHFEKYGLAAIDPYMLSLNCIVERFIFKLDAKGKQGLIIAESRNSILDNHLELAFLNLKVQGTNYISASKVKKLISQLLIKNKKENIVGLQIADLIANPIGREILGKKNQIDYRIIGRKYRTKDGKYIGYGLVVLPKK